MLALFALSVLFWPSRSSRINFWQDRLFSPGTVSLAHHTDAAGNKMTCRSCHQPGHAITNRTCISCHNREDFEKNQPALADSHQIFERYGNCLDCHEEHDGDYMSLKSKGLPANIHRSMPVKTDKCVDCHRLDGEAAHPYVKNEDCAGCHKNYRWTSDFRHINYLSRATSADKLLELCRQCHDNGFHYTVGTRVREGCVFCHEVWGKQRKKRPVPYPEGLFKDIKIKS